MARPRIVDVARVAGVSKTAVSFAFNQPENLNEATRDRILAIATELGYRPSPIARRLASRRTDQIGLVVPQATHEILANPFLAELLRGLGDECDEEGISLVIVPPVGGSIARSISGALVDGLVLLGLSRSHPELDGVRGSALPTVALDVDAWDGLDVIRIDDEGGSKAVGEHLRGLGHTDIAAVLIADDPESGFLNDTGISGRRLDGLRAGLGLPPGQNQADDMRLRVIASAVSIDGGRAAFELLADEGLPTAVATVTDVSAIGLMLAAADAGVSVPDDLSVVGYDDISESTWTTPRLTTVHQPIREKGRLAARLLIDRIRSDSTRRPMSELLATRLVVRGSTAPPRMAPLSAPEGGGGADAR
jgi:DNA-binding LacI/PurR family transcriptional regulator